MTREDTMEYLDRLVSLIGDAEEEIEHVVMEHDGDCEEATEVAQVMLAQMECTLSKVLDIRDGWLS